MCYIVDKKPTILYGELPSYDEKGADLSRLKTLAEGEVLDEVPESLETSWGMRYLVARTGTKYMVIGLDMGICMNMTRRLRGSIGWIAV